MKKNNQNQTFEELSSEFVTPIAKWQRRKPKQRKALLFMVDQAEGEWVAFQLGNKRERYPKSDITGAMKEWLKQDNEFRGWLEATLRCIEREKKKGESGE